VRGCLSIFLSKEQRDRVRWGGGKGKRKINTFEIDVVVDDVDGRLLLTHAAHWVLLAPL